MSHAIRITRQEWAKIPRDYKGTMDGAKYCFAGSLPSRVKGETTSTGTALVFVAIAKLEG